MDLKYEFYYKFKEVTTEKYGDIENVIIEIRFFHCLNAIGDDENNPEIHKLMVLHFPYVEGEPYVDGTNITKELLIKAIENKLGAEEIKKMEESLIYQYHEKLQIVTKKKITLDL